jgi:hypothetical protein
MARELFYAGKPSLESVNRQVVETFGYNPETGDLWRKANGYIITSLTVRIEEHSIKISRVAWFLHHGDWPPEGYWIDHINQHKYDNRMVNLRLATPTENQQNKAGYGWLPKGVSLRQEANRAKPYQARIRVNGERLLLGSFATAEEAAVAYQEACIKYHGEFACPT